MRRTPSSTLLPSGAAAVLLGLGLAFLTLPLRSQDTLGIGRPGLILLKTESATFQVTLRDGAFGPGSDPFVALQLSNLVGQELRTSPTGLFGTAGPDGRPPVDTVLELQHPVAGPPGSAEFRIVGLHLKNQADHPLTVTYNGGGNPQLWDVEVCLSATKQLGGFLQLERPQGTNVCGGTFTYSLAVTPKLIFKRRPAPGEPVPPPVTLDPGSSGFASFAARGQWADRDQFGYKVGGSSLGDGVFLFEAAPFFRDAFLDADCDGIFDRDSADDCLTERLPTLRSSDLVLGAECVANEAPGVNPPNRWHLQPYTEGGIQTQVVQAATRASASYPLSLTDRLGFEPGRRGAAGLAGLAVLGLTAVLFPVRRGRER